VNAAIMAVRILAISRPELRDRVQARLEEESARVLRETLP
jgi:phosphoribosylcarboxyaminoimidazole (NCAIR) mutase